MRPTCKTCQYWTDNPDGYTGLSECRRNPPIGANGSGAREYPKWPKTHGHDWCGEHRQQEQSND